MSQKSQYAKSVKSLIRIKIRESRGKKSNATLRNTNRKATCLSVMLNKIIFKIVILSLVEKEIK